MDTLLFWASSQKWLVRTTFTVLILAMVFTFTHVIDYTLALSGQSAKTLNVRGGIFLMAFMFTVIIACVFSRGHNYRGPAIALLAVFLFETLFIFVAISIFDGADLAKMIVFPFAYGLGYFAYQLRDVIPLYVCGIFNKGAIKGRSSRALNSTLEYSITAPLIGKGLRWLALLYSAYTLVSIAYVSYRGLKVTTPASIRESILVNSDFDFVYYGSYFMDAITLYIIVILIGGISKSIRDDKARNATMV
jgi:hypothetical protein